MSKPTHYPPYATVEKSVGETPLDALKRFRHENELPETVKTAYAGRLDPMASGKLLLLIGDTCKRQQQFHTLDKEYEFSILFGLATDTHDVLGRITKISVPNNIEGDLQKAIRSIQSETHLELPYPIFSSKTVNGVPLHTWALREKLKEINIPVQTSTIYRIKLDKVYPLTGEETYHRATTKINSLPTVTEASKAEGADFRRQDVLADWQNFYDHHHSDTFIEAKLTATVSSGTYIRSLAHYLGQQCQTGAIASSIHRTKIGKYQTLFRQYGWWKKRY